VVVAGHVPELIGEQLLRRSLGQEEVVNGSLIEVAAAIHSPVLDCGELAPDGMALHVVENDVPELRGGFSLVTADEITSGSISRRFS